MNGDSEAAREQGVLEGSLVIHPPLDTAYVASEHPEGQLDHLGDALGTDFIVIRFLEGWARMYRGDGKRNEEWFGWRARVLAPVDATVIRVTEPGRPNEPGERGRGSAGGVVLRRSDGVHVALAHLREITVAEGETVHAGQVIARLGNNGVSSAPHLHVGAWSGERPLQLIVDLAALGRLMRSQGEASFYGLPPELTSTGT